MYKVSIICCYTREDILESMLEEGLKIQENVEIERIYFKNQFSCAAAAYNYAIKKTKSDNLIFVHQDVKFLEKDFLYKIAKQIDKEKNALYGLCGTKVGQNQNGHETISNIYHGLRRKRIGSREIYDIEQVMGLDEVCVMCHKSLFRTIKYDDKNFDGWHIFVADLCMQAYLHDIKVYVVPFKCQHKNILEMPGYMYTYGHFPKEYFYYLRKLRNKYKRNIVEIFTPCASFKTNFFQYNIMYWKTYLGACRRRLLRKWSMR